MPLIGGDQSGEVTKTKSLHEEIPKDYINLFMRRRDPKTKNLFMRAEGSPRLNLMRIPRLYKSLHKGGSPKIQSRFKLGKVCKE